jgi:3-oxoacyl-[acyl-carrier protein] reductase
MDALLARQALSRMGEVRDVINAVDFYLREESDFITGQVLYLGGIN